MTELTEEQRLQISEQAQSNVDFILDVSNKSRSDRLQTIVALVAYYEEGLHWAREAMARIEKDRGK